MTETEWLECINPHWMLDHLKDTLGERKQRLLAAACVRRIGQLLKDERSRNAVEVCEKYADGLVDEVQLAHTWITARNAARKAPDQLEWEIRRAANWLTNKKAVVAVKES